MRAAFLAATAATAFTLGGCSRPPAAPAPTTAGAKPTAADAAAFVARINAEDAAGYPELVAAQWLSQNFISDESQLLNARVGDRALATVTEQLDEAKKFVGVELPPELARQLEIIKALNPMSPSPVAPPSNPAHRAELTMLLTKLDGEYGAGKFCAPAVDGKPADCRNLDQLSKILSDPKATPAARTEAWAGWHTIAKPMRKDYVRLTELANEGATELGYRDVGELWRAGYDMTPAEFSAETERLWSQVKPLYEQLHCYVRGRLNATYGDAVVPKQGLIPAQLLGNMWAQSWENIYPQVEPYPGVGNLDVTPVLKAEREATLSKLLAERYPKAKPTPEQAAELGHEAERAESIAMAKRAEAFYTSLGFPALPETFWQKSLLTRPRDRDVVCHASAWDMDQHGDVRVKMCIDPTEEDLTTIHHELGHIYYFLMYNGLPALYQQGAHDGFHEAIGDTITLSLTPKHLETIGLVKDVKEDQKALINAQMKRALEKIAFLPFGKLIDQWRWKVFSGEIKPADYNRGWWALREGYQGIAPPIARSEDDFDPGAKYHVAGNVPYTRYFLSFIIQFQFHKALCDAAGFKGPLYECDIYGNKAAGEKFAAMLKKGASQPWPQTLKELTGGTQMDASAISEYFAPLAAWLKQQNAGQSCGWTPPADPLAGPQQAALAN